MYFEFISHMSYIYILKCAGRVASANADAGAEVKVRVGAGVGVGMGATGVSAAEVRNSQKSPPYSFSIRKVTE